MSLVDRWREAQGKSLEPGVYKFDGKGEMAHHRFHLRVDSRHRGVLLVDASALLFLNGTGLDYMRLILEGRDEKQAARYMTIRYKNMDKAKAIADFEATRRRLLDFLHGEPDVVEVIGSETPTFGADAFPAPYRMDLALTYRCQNRCAHCYNEPRQSKELPPSEWKKVIGKLWELGIPHIVLTGGEPTLIPELIDLIRESEKYGQITGLVTNGRKLAAPGLLASMTREGLDHVQITVLSFRESVHDRLVGDDGAWKETVAGLKVALQEDLYVSTNTTIMRSNLDDMEETMRFLAGLGVKNIAFNGIIRSGGGKTAESISYEELSSLLPRLKTIAAETGSRLIWYTPTPYCEFNPINRGLGIKQCTACALNMAIEPDGTVLPCQSCYRPLGNILSDPWESIWNSETCKSFRERKYIDGECVDCGLKEACAGGCPLSREHGDYACLDIHSSL